MQRRKQQISHRFQPVYVWVQQDVRRDVLIMIRPDWQHSCRSPTPQKASNVQTALLILTSIYKCIQMKNKYTWRKFCAQMDCNAPQSLDRSSSRLHNDSNEVWLCVFRVCRVVSFECRAAPTELKKTLTGCYCSIRPEVSMMLQELFLRLKNKGILCIVRVNMTRLEIYQVTKAV